MTQEKSQENKEKPQAPQENKEKQRADNQEYIEKIVAPKKKAYSKLAEETIKTSGKEKEELKKEVQFKTAKGVEQYFDTAEEKIKKASREKREEILKEAERNAKRHLESIEAMVFNLTNKGKEELDEKDLYDLLKLSESASKTIKMPEEYRELFLKAQSGAELAPDELRKLARLIRPQNLRSNLENIKCAPAGALVAMISPAQRMELSKYVIDNQPNSAKEWIEIMTAVNMITVAQAEKLWNYAAKKGNTKAAFSESKMAELQKDMKNLVDKRISWITKPDDRNPAVRMLTLGNFGKLAMIFWGSLELLLNGAIAYKSGNYEGLKTYGLAGLAAIMGGSYLLKGKVPGAETIGEKSAEQKEKSVIEKTEKQIMEILGSHPSLAKYLRNGGYSATRLALYKNFKEKRQTTFTFEDLEKIERNPERQKEITLLAKEYPGSIEDLNNIAHISEELQGLETKQKGSGKSAEEIAKLSSIMNWSFDPDKPEDSQIKFSGFYDKYVTNYGLSEAA
ncbi:hypothetical protein HZA39_04550 [Candidatus Peregrinibacteria bacterium]|nr:hypothetical protein [Candidatus Peregrinibacteria bacterium]